MHVIEVASVDEAFYRGCRLVLERGVRTSSRNGDVIVLDAPLVTVYNNPVDRVLTLEGRNENPFFHLFESLWMLAGRNNARYLDNFVKDFSSRYAQDGGVQHGAYGYRWRNHFGKDQLLQTIDMLRKDPLDRRVVIQMWDPRSDMGVNGTVKDVPCNLSIVPRIVNGALDINVTCRSNDMFWGAYGANAVHMSVLQEFLAHAIGVRIGVYRQISLNAHIYDNVVEKVEKILNTGLPRFNTETIKPLLSKEKYIDFLIDCYELTGGHWDPGNAALRTMFCKTVAAPMLRTHEALRHRDYESADRWAEAIDCPQWRGAVRRFCKRSKGIKKETK